MKHAATLVLVTLLLAGSASAQSYESPRNALGQPDLEGGWTNATMTPQTRPAQYGTRRAMTPAEVAKIEGAAAAQIERGNKATDPDAPTVADGSVGGYNRGFLDPGILVMRVGGEPRTSLLTTPNGQVPAPRAGSRASAAEMRTFSGSPYFIDEYGSAALFGEDQQTARRFNNPEELSLADRCLTSFGRNGPPPMMPNGFYNNNYQIAQAPDAVLIITEMVHDARVIRLNTREHAPASIRPWFGDSVGWYDGGTLVVETTNFPKAQAWFGQASQLHRTYVASLSAMGWTVLLSLVLIGLGWTRSPLTVADPWVWTQLLAVAVFASALGGYFWNVGASRLGVAIASLWVNLVPFFAVLWSMAYGFMPNAYQILGGLVALSGVVYMQWRKLQTTPR